LFSSDIFDKYLFTGTFRRDGASVNAKDFKWTDNPAGAFAWKMHKESFLENITSRIETNREDEEDYEDE